MSQAQIGNLQVALGINTAQFAAGLSQAQGSLATFGKGLKAFAASVGATLSLGAIGMAIKSNIDRMDELGKAAQKIGIPVDELSKLEYAGRLADISLDSLTTTMAKFSKSLVEVVGGGTNDTGAALKAIGVAAVDVQGQLRPTSEIIADVAEEFSVMRDGAGKTALAIALFGKSGAEMIPLLNGGREAISGAGRELQQFGGVVTPEATRRAQDFNDNLTRLQTAFTGLLQEAIAPILPDLIKLTQYFIELAKTGAPIKEWVTNTIAFFAELKPFIESTRREIELLTEGMRYLGLVDPAPLEISIPGADLAPPIDAPQQTKDAPILPDLTASKKAADEAAAALERLKAEGQSVWEATRTPLESYQLGIRNLNGLLQQGVIDHETYDRAVKQLQEEFAQSVPAADDFKNSLEDISQTISNSLSYALEGLISGTMSVKDAFRSMAASISQQLAQLASQFLRSAVFKMLGSLVGGSFGGLGGMSFGGFYANGGNLGSGKWGIAGENGPEIIHGPASITPMGKAGGQAPQMNVTVINNSSASVSTRKGANGGLEVMVEEMIADKLLRGGNKIDSALARGYGLRRAGR